MYFFPRLSVILSKNNLVKIWLCFSLVSLSTTNIFAEGFQRPDNHRGLDLVCSSSLKYFFDQTKTGNSIWSPFLRDVVSPILGFGGMFNSENGNIINKDFKVKGNMLFFPKTGEEVVQLIVSLDPKIKQAYFKYNIETKILMLKGNESVEEQQELLRQLVVGTNFSPYVQSPAKKIQRNALGLSKMILKNDQVQVMDVVKHYLSVLKEGTAQQAKMARKLLFVAPTGMGKTEIFKRLFSIRLKSKKPKIHIVLSDKIFLSKTLKKEIEQIEDDSVQIIEWDGTNLSDPRKLEEVVRDFKKSKKHLVIISTVQSLRNVKNQYSENNDTLKAFRDELSTVFFDEAHHIGAEHTSHLMDYFVNQATQKDLFMLGVTATPFHEEKSILDIFNHSVYFSYIDDAESVIDRLDQAIDDGNPLELEIGAREVLEQLKMGIRKGELTPIRSQTILNENALSIPTGKMFIKGKGNRYRFNPDYYEHLFERLKLKILDNPKGMIIVNSQEEAKELAAYLNRNKETFNRRFDYVSSVRGVNENLEVQRRYETGEVDYIISVRMLDEGVRFKGMTLYIDLNTTFTVRSMLQRLGRVLGLELNKHGVDVVYLAPNNFLELNIPDEMLLFLEEMKHGSLSLKHNSDEVEVVDHLIYKIKNLINGRLEAKIEENLKNPESYFTELAEISSRQVSNYSIRKLRLIKVLRKMSKDERVELRDYIKKKNQRTWEYFCLEIDK